jgi:SSS family solute:Na+ symporter
MGAAGILGLAVVFVPSFFVSPGLIQKTFGARSPSAARGAALGNAVALAVFAFVPAVFGMAMRAVEPGLGNPELALPRLTTDVLPPWLGGLALAALFAAEISTADAVLFMLSTTRICCGWAAWRRQWGAGWVSCWRSSCRRWRRP